MTDSSPSPRSLYALAAVGGLVLLFLFMQGSFADKVKPGMTVYASNPLATGRAVAVARIVEETHRLTWPGTVIAPSETRLAARVAGRILTMTVRSGDRIRRGQVLVRIDASELEARVAAARAALAAAEAASLKAAADDRRIRTLYAGEAATRQELDASTAASVGGQARVREAREVLRATESVLAETAITAPYDGVVVHRLMEPGDMALPGQPVLSLQQAGGLELEASVPVACAGFLHTGDSVTVRTARDDTPLIASVHEIQPTADPLTHTVRVKARLPDNHNLRPGTPARLEQYCGSESRLTIPATALTRSGQLTTVQWIAVDGTARLRHVRTGQRFGGDIEILAGLEPGDRVALPQGVQP